LIFSILKGYLRTKDYGKKEPDTGGQDVFSQGSKKRGRRRKQEKREVRSNHKTHSGKEQLPPEKKKTKRVG